ncbi:HNH endonuclease signature motif containing protein [Nocardia sp. NPDC051981]|uniref:HNH endonuclease n=1 Tax=Nocardia sp. NPDC051981 TaxID=3155417 RepID=UPI00344945F5
MICSPGSLCVYCGALATCIDHVRPVAAGGDSSAGNLEPSCAQCNLDKNCQTLAHKIRTPLIMPTMKRPSTSRSGSITRCRARTRLQAEATRGCRAFAVVSGSADGCHRVVDHERHQPIWTVS